MTSVLVSGKTIHAAHVKDGAAYPVCGGRSRIGVSAEVINAAPTCKTCKKRA
jgi:hypothetical protein